jgi:hypothetical protein
MTYVFKQISIDQTLEPWINYRIFVT